MTKTNLIKIINHIKETEFPEVIDHLAPSMGILYNSRLFNKPIVVYTNKNGNPIAVYHNHVMYAMCTTDPVRTTIARDNYKALDCHTKVYLYPNNKNLMFRDEQGPVYYGRLNSPVYGDYEQLIPLPPVYKV